MNNNTPINLRIRFKKIGNLQYISHLDLVRTMQKIIVRSALPLWYTEGFNPKPKMVFAAPLSIGTQSVVEFMDLRLNEKIDPAVAMAKLNANMTDEMQVIEAYYPETKLTDLKWMTYTVEIFEENLSSELADRINTAFLKEKIEVMKKGKKGESLVDIKPLIRSADAVFTGNSVRINALLSADQSLFLNPEHIIKYLKNECAILASDNLLSQGYTIMREEAYKEDMSIFR